MEPMKFNLQLFSGEKTEEATPKKRKDAREKGQVVQSKDVNTALIILAVAVGINIFSGYFIENIFGFYYFLMDKMSDPAGLYQNGEIMIVLRELIIHTLQMSIPLMLIAMIVGVLASYLQIGFLFTTKTLQPKLDKINPINGFKRLFSIRSIVELVKSVLKSVVLLYITFSYLNSRQMEFILIFDKNIQDIVLLMWDMAYNIIIRASGFLLFIAFLDYLYKRWQNNKDLRMSKQDIKDEYKQTEGDPLLKSRIKEKQRQFAQSRMMQDVPKADVIITNPTHFAVAIRYDTGIADAPQVIAKGADLIAKNIKRIAEENNVPIVENKPLARELYASLEIGDLVPPDLYEAVAEVLAYVYNLKK